MSTSKVQSELGNNQNSNSTQRQSNIELLRIIAMILIVAHHFSVHGGFKFSNEVITANLLWIQFLKLGGKIGVNIFVLISGYFLITKSSVKTNKVLKLWLQIFTCSMFFYVLFVIVGIEPFKISSFIKSLFSLIFARWWFATTYFALYLFSPFLNKLLISLDKKDYKKLLLLMFAFWCLVPTFTSKSFCGNYLLWFTFLYAVAGYIRLHISLEDIDAFKYIMTAVVIIVCTYLSAVVFDVLGMKISVFSEHSTYFFGETRFPIFIISVLLFVGFSKVNIGCKPVINVISSATFGVYLIHEHVFVRKFLWKTLFKNAAFAESSILIPYSLMAIAAVFLTCTIIELCRIYLFEKHYMKMVDRVASKVDKLIEQIK